MRKACELQMRGQDRLLCRARRASGTNIERESVEAQGWRRPLQKRLKIHPRSTATGRLASRPSRRGRPAAAGRRRPRDRSPPRWSDRHGPDGTVDCRRVKFQACPMACPFPAHRRRHGHWPSAGRDAAIDRQEGAICVCDSSPRHGAGSKPVAGDREEMRRDTSDALTSEPFF